MGIKFDIRHKPFDGDLLLTMACPVGCDFCVYSCLPSMEPQKWMPEETIRRVAEEYSKNDIAIRICGGEPFYNLEKLKTCIDILLEYYNPFDLDIITSAVFAGSKENAIRNLKVIKDANFDSMLVSVDRFHLPRVPLQKIINVIEAAKGMDIEPVLRLSLDMLSFQLMDEIAKIIVKYQTPIEVHSWGVVGRAENLDTSVLENYNIVESYMFNKISLCAKKNNSPPDYRYYLHGHAAKRSQRKIAPSFYPTTFPNGNVYATSYTFKSEYMGNINTENLFDMIATFGDTFFGHFILSEHDNDVFNKFVPKKFEDKFDMSRNVPLSEDMKEEAIGRRFIKIDSGDNFDDIFKKMIEERKFHGPYGVEDREFLISFRLKAEDLWNKETEKKISKFLNNLKLKKIKFVLSRPLPPCLKIVVDEKQPKNCFECRELFTVENGMIKFVCDCIKDTKGPEIDIIKSRKQIYDIFDEIHKKQKPAEICRNCIYYLRRDCNSMYFKG